MTENIVQAIARDLMVEDAMEIDEPLPVVFTAHDEIIAEGRRSGDLGFVTSILSTPPLWASDLPLDAEGFVSPRYAKEKYI